MLSSIPTVVKERGRGSWNIPPLSLPIFFWDTLIYAFNLKSNYKERIRFTKKKWWKCTESFLENMQSDFEVLRAKRVFIVLFSEKVVLYRQPREPVIFFRSS